jgi:hypothetical protein
LHRQRECPSPLSSMSWQCEAGTIHRIVHDMGQHVITCSSHQSVITDNHREKCGMMHVNMKQGAACRCMFTAKLSMYCTYIKEARDRTSSMSTYGKRASNGTKSNCGTAANRGGEANTIWRRKEVLLCYTFQQISSAFWTQRPITPGGGTLSRPCMVRGCGHNRQHMGQVPSLLAWL